MASSVVTNRTFKKAVSGDVSLDGTAISATALISVKSANHRIYITKVTLNIETHANSKVFVIEDSASTPVTIASHTDLTFAAGVPSVVTWDFGEEGFPATLGKDINYVANTGGTGFVGNFHVEGYETLVGPVAAASTN